MTSHSSGPRGFDHVAIEVIGAAPDGSALADVVDEAFALLLEGPAARAAPGGPETFIRVR